MFADHDVKPGRLPAARDELSSAARHEVFAAIIGLHIRSEPTDDLTTDWERVCRGAHINRPARQRPAPIAWPPP